MWEVRLHSQPDRVSHKGSSAAWGPWAAGPSPAIRHSASPNSSVPRRSQRIRSRRKPWSQANEPAAGGLDNEYLSTTYTDAALPKTVTGTSGYLLGAS